MRPDAGAAQTVGLWSWPLPGPPGWGTEPSVTAGTADKRIRGPPRVDEKTQVEETRGPCTQRPREGGSVILKPASFLPQMHVFENRVLSKKIPERARLSGESTWPMTQPVACCANKQRRPMEEGRQKQTLVVLSCAFPTHV